MPVHQRKHLSELPGDLDHSEIGDEQDSEEYCGPKVRDVDQECRIFDGWTEVSQSYKTKSDWSLLRRSIKEKALPTAKVKLLRLHRMESLGIDVQRERFFNLYHISQTREMRATALSTARLQFYERFAKHSDWQRLIRWTQGAYINTDDGSVWDSDIQKWGWRTYKEKLSLSKLADHEMGRDIYGIFGAESSYFLMIDIDLHNQPLDLFETRLQLLIERFHGRHRCHFQVSDSKVGGVHLILFSGKPGLLSNRHKWLLRQPSEIDDGDPSGQFTRLTGAGRVFNIEVYPDHSHAVRLPLARGRTMLLDVPLQLISRRGRMVQDVVGYMNWLNQDRSTRSYMSKDDAFKYVMERLDHTLAIPSSTEFESVRPKNRTVASGGTLGPKDSGTSLKGQTRHAIIDYWQNGDGTGFCHLNSAILTTLQAIHAEGVDQEIAEAILSEYATDLPNKNLSSRLTVDPGSIRREIARQAKKIWSTDCNVKWQNTTQQWSSYGFKVSDKTTWCMKPKLKFEEVIVDCEDIQFSELELKLIKERIAPLLVGKKQANKSGKQDEVIRAVAYFLRYVRCCPREIPYKAVPTILSGFKLRLGKDCKSSLFLIALTDLEWIYVKTDYYCPKFHGGPAGTGRARAYGIGAAIAAKFGNLSIQTTTTNRDLSSVIPFFDGWMQEEQWTVESD